MLFCDIRNNRRKINESDRRDRVHKDRTGKFDKIIVGKSRYQFKVEIDFVSIEIYYNPEPRDEYSKEAYVVSGIISDGFTSLNNLICDPDLMRKVADFMEPLVDQNGKIDTEVLEGILADNNL